jgi:hypothetical protein
VLLVPYGGLAAATALAAAAAATVQQQLLLHRAYSQHVCTVHSPVS